MPSSLKTCREEFFLKILFIIGLTSITLSNNIFSITYIIESSSFIFFGLVLEQPDPDEIITILFTSFYFGLISRVYEWNHLICVLFTIVWLYVVIYRMLLYPFVFRKCAFT